MSRSPSKSRRPALKAIPWAALLQAGMVLGNRLGELSKKDRASLARLLRDSKGWPGSLTTKEREELRRILARLDAKRMTRELMPLVRRGGRGRKRR